MSEKLLMAIDVGTTNTKGALYNLDGKVQHFTSRKHTISCPKEGYAEHDAEAIWWTEVKEICQELTSNANVCPQDIVSVGISTLSPALLPVDQDGNPLYPAMLYRLDSRAQKELEELSAFLGVESISPLEIAPKILWLKRNEPEVFQKAAYFIGAQSFLVNRLTGNMVAEYGFGGVLFSKGSMAWDKKLCDKCGVTEEQFPKLKFASEEGGTITPWAAAETGLAVGTTVSVGTGDFSAECCSYGTVFASSIKLSFGTTVGVNFGHNMAGTLFRNGSFGKPMKETRRGGAMPSGCSTIDWIISIISGLRKEDRVSDEVLEQLVSSTPPGSNGVTIIPYLNGGNGAPVYNPSAKGAIFGLQNKHGPAELYRASLEALAYSIRHILLPAPNGIEEAVVLGGGTKIPGLLQIVSDVTGFKLTILQLTNGSLAGDAFLAGMACGIFKDLSDINLWIKTGKTIVPDPGKRRIYDMGYDKFIALYNATMGLM